MSNELVNIGADLPLQAADDAQLDKLSERAFLPRMQLMGSSTGLVKEGKAKVGTWALIHSKDKFDDLTSSTEVLVLARRARAVRMGQRGILSVFDMSDPEFKKIEDDAGSPNSGCFYGPEYLMWSRVVRLFCTYHANNATARTASLDLNNILKAWTMALAAAAKAKGEGKVLEVQNPQVLCRTSFIKGSNGFQWWGPQFTRATTPFSELPSTDDVREQVMKFVSPPKNETETADAVESRG